MTAKETVLYALGTLPDDATMDDIVERVVFVAHLQKGLDDLAAGNTIPHEQVMAEMEELIQELEQEALAREAAGQVIPTAR